MFVALDVFLFKILSLKICRQSESVGFECDAKNLHMDRVSELKSARQWYYQN